jgi:hypothetical protein
MSDPSGSLLSATVTMPRNRSGLNGGVAVDAWRNRANEIADIERQNISDRTPEQTGTLDASLTEQLNPDDQTIAQVYTDPDVQMSGPWGRVYAQYQEGPPLGVSTYTNAPRQFIDGALAEDTGQIGSWAKQVASQGVIDGIQGIGYTNQTGP